MSTDDAISSGEDDTVMITRDDLSNYNEANFLPESPLVLEKIRAWLRPTAYNTDSSEYRKHLASHLSGTGSWLTSSDAYRQWHDGTDHGTLWIKGFPGSGKSVIAAMLADQLSNNHKGVPVLHFFFRQIIDANHTPASLLRDWLEQVLIYSPPLQRQLKEHVENGRSLESLTMDVLWQNLRNAFSDLPGRVYCIADALDEMDGGHDEFILALADLGQWKPSKVKVLITSRPMPNIEVLLRKTCLQIRLQENLVDTDIAAYIQHGLENLTISTADQDLIKETVLMRACGLFLYAKLALDGFHAPGTSVREVLRLLPADLNSIYSSLLQEHTRRSGVPYAIQSFILQWVTHSIRPVRLLELAELIKFTHKTLDLVDMKARKDFIRVACGPLLEILPDETVSIVHHSFTEYLNGSTRPYSPTAALSNQSPILEFGLTHARLALICLEYLQSGCLSHWKVEKRTPGQQYRLTPARSSQLSDLRMKSLFVEYATANWHIHAHKADLTGVSFSKIHKVLDNVLSRRQFVEAWLDINWPSDAIEGATPLHVGARTGLSQYVQVLLKRGDIEVDAQDSQGNTPLFWAASMGFIKVAQLLLQGGASPDQENNDGLKPLHKAANNNHPDMVKLLLSVGVDPLTAKTKGRSTWGVDGYKEAKGVTPLTYACKNGHLEVFESLLPFLDIPTLHRALAWAASSGREKIVERILQEPSIDVNTKIQGDTSLFLACKNGDPGTIKKLLLSGADPNVICKKAKDEFEDDIGSWDFWRGSVNKDSRRGYTALHVLHHGPTSCRKSKSVECEKLQESFSLLLKAGADIHQRDPKGWTPLHHAARCPAKIRLLVKAGADINSQTDDGETVINMRDFVDDVATVRLLTKTAMADIGQRSKSKGKILLSLLKERKSDNALSFLECRPDCNVIDEEGNSPLHYALQLSMRNQSPLITALLKEGANPNLKNHRGQAPLRIINTPDKFMQLGPLLLHAGADIEAQDNEGKTWLFVNSVNIRIEEIQEALHLGARAGTRDYKGRTILHEVIKHFDPIIKNFEYLISIGVDPKAVDNSGNTLFHELFRTGTAQLSEELLHHGLDPDQANYAGRTPLHDLCSKGLDEPIDFNPRSDIDAMLSLCKNIDAMDNDGVRPLHLAAMVSDYIFAHLLNSGANLTSATFEGLTALHLAARARQSNIVGMIITALGDEDPPNLISFINAKDAKGSTALHYACRSGRPETVALLINAGADPSIANAKRHTPLHSCAEFEKEQKLWDGYRRTTAEDRTTLWEAGWGGRTDAFLSTDGAKIEDISRPFVDSGKELIKFLGKGWPTEIRTCQETARLDEIVEMLLAHISKSSKDTSWAEKAIGGMVRSAQEVGNDYTASCLNRVPAPFRPETSSSSFFSGGFDEILSKHRKLVATRAFNEFDKFVNGSQDLAIFIRLLKMREFDLVVEMFHKGTDFLGTKNVDDETNMHILANNGYATLLERIGVLEAQAGFKEGVWHAAGNPQSPGLGICVKDPGLNDPLLLTACRREIPNMEVIIVLVEKLGVDINAQNHDTASRYTFGKPIRGGTSALHSLASGVRWWHAAQGIPYLVGHGADIELRNFYDQTPLLVALESTFPFQKQAAKALISFGADVNAVDGQGRSCLELAGKDPDLCRLLLSRGADLTASALFGTIRAHNVESLEVLLSAGIDPNIRPDPVDEKIMEERKKKNQSLRRGGLFSDSDVDLSEWYSLRYATSIKSKVWRVHGPFRAANMEKQRAQIMMLLAYGANPYAIFNEPINPRTAEEAANSMLLGDDIFELKLDTELDGLVDPIVRNPKGNEDEDVEMRDHPSKPSTPKLRHARRCIIHTLLEEGSFIQPLMELPALEIERRDPQGRTIFLAACRSALGADAPLDATLFHVGGNVDDFYYKNNPLSRQDSTSLVQYLLRRGADPLARDNRCKNALHHLMEAYDSRSQSSRAPIVRASLQLLASSFPVLLSQHDVTGDFPLHTALKRLRRNGYRGRYNGFADVEGAIEDLISAGSDTHVSDGRGNTALHHLSVGLVGGTGGEKQRRLFRLFLDAGVDVNARNKTGCTAPFAFFDDDGMLSQGFAPPGFASTREVKQGVDEIEKEVLGWFDEAGAEWDARDWKGRTMLHIVARHNSPRAVERFKFLVAKGVDAMLEDEEKRTALDIAAACGNKGVLELFER